jgi:hypothetical protein
MGGHVRVQHYRLNASETFFEGEPVAVNADGELTESADDPVDADLMGIAQGGPGAGRTNPKTGVNWATGDMVPVVIPDQNTYFITQNYSAAGSAFDDTAPALANIGDEAGLSLISNSWGVDISATNNLVRIVDVLDDQKNSVQEAGTTVSTGNIYYVVFQIVAHQSTSLGTADAPAA